MKELLKYSPKVNTYCSIFGTPLHSAINTYNYEAVELLLNNGAKMHVKGKYDKTAFELAKSKKYDCIEGENIFALLERKNSELLEKLSNLRL